MSSLQMSHVDLEQGNHHHHHHHHPSSVVGSDVSGEGSLCFSDADDGSSYSRFYSTNGGSYDDYSFACVSDDPELGDGGGGGVVLDSARFSSVTDCSVEIRTGVPEIKVHLAKVEKDCRICHMDLECESHESGPPIELGCSCKEDLAAAHKNCAEAWFKIKGNSGFGRGTYEYEIRRRGFESRPQMTCEICHSVARNVYSANEDSTEHVIDSNNTTASSTLSTAAPTPETQRFWHGHRFLNFLLACMVFAFVISWLFHFNMPSS